MSDTCPSLEVNVAGIQMKNPVMTASGTFGYGSEYVDFIDLNKLGAVVVKGITSVPWTGNSMPRIFETPSGMLNAIGLQNVGVDGFIDKKLPVPPQFRCSRNCQHLRGAGRRVSRGYGEIGRCRWGCCNRAQYLVPEPSLRRNEFWR